MCCAPSYIQCMMTDGFKTYEVLLRRLLRGWQNQAKYAIFGFFACVGGGFGCFLALQTLHVVDRREVVDVAEGDGLNGKEVRQSGAHVCQGASKHTQEHVEEKHNIK